MPLVKYYYKGISLKKYCELNGYKYQTISSQLKTVTDANLSNKIIADFFSKPPVNKRPLYEIEGLSLRKYCEKYDYKYPTIKTYISNIRKDNPKFTNEEIVLKAVSYYRENHIEKELWFYRGMRLIDFCNKNGYSYKNMHGYLRLIGVKDSKNITEDEMNLAIKKMNIKRRKDIFDKLKNSETLDQYQEIISDLKIDNDSIKLLCDEFNFNIDKAIYFIWYFGEENDDSIKIDLNKIYEIFNYLKKIDELEINLLLGYYYSGICDTRQIIYDKINISVKKILYDLCRKHEIKISSPFFTELSQQSEYLIFEFIERTTSRYLGQIINYMNSYIEGSLTHFILNEMKQNCVSLNSKKYDDDEKEKIDFIANKDDDFDNEYFSNDMLSIINTLNDEEKNFIILKYQKQLTDEKLSKYLKISIEEISNINNKIMEKLRSNLKIKKLYPNHDV